MKEIIEQNKCVKAQNEACYITITIEQSETPLEYYKSISLKEKRFPTIQRYFLRGNNVAFFEAYIGFCTKRKNDLNISTKEILFPMIQRYFLRGNNTINYRNIVSLREMI